MLRGSQKMQNIKSKKKITISSDSCEVECRLSDKDAIKVRERLRLYRGVGYSNETILERYENYRRRYLNSAKYYGCGNLNHDYNSVEYTIECLVMSEVFKRLAEERGIYI